MNILKAIASGAAVGLALLTTTAPVSAGGDVIYTGVKGMRGTAEAVPVPAPVPVPEIASGYYIRADAAYSFNSIDKYSASDANLDASRQDDGLSNFGRYGIGVGYHFSKWLRGDMTLDMRNEVRSKGNGSIAYSGPNDLTPAPGHTIQMRDEVFDRFRTKNYTALMNGYVDIPVNERFTPYVGGGVGLVMHTTTLRQAYKFTHCVDAVNCNPAANGGLVAHDPAYTGLNSTSSSAKEDSNDNRYVVRQRLGLIV